MKARKPRGLDKGEHELHLAIVELELGALRDFVTALAKTYPHPEVREMRGTGAVWDALWHLLTVVRLIERRCSKLRKRSCAHSRPGSSGTAGPLEHGAERSFGACDCGRAEAPEARRYLFTH